MEEGWELVKVEFGVPAGSPEPLEDGYFPNLPYMILYNRYTGVLRFFGAYVNQMTTYQTIQIELSIPKSDDNNNYNPNLKATNLLSINGDAIQPLDQETSKTRHNVFIRASNSQETMFWFDLPVAYDPCICNLASQLDIKFLWIKEASVSITGSEPGSITTQSSSSENYAVMVTTRIIAAAMAVAVAKLTGGTVVNVKAFVDLLDIAIKHPNMAQSDKANLEKFKSYLDCSSKYAGVIIKNQGYFPDFQNLSNLEKAQIKAGNEVMEANTTFFSSLSKGCNDKDNGAAAISRFITAKGKIEEVSEVDNSAIHLAMPGSNWDNILLKRTYDASSGPDNTFVPSYPMYNERLGTFALLETPTVRFDYLHSYDFSRVGLYHDPQINLVKQHTIVFKMKLSSENLKYTFNPKLNLDMEKTIVQARIVIRNPFDLDSLHLFPPVIRNFNEIQTRKLKFWFETQHWNWLCHWDREFTFGNINCKANNESIYQVYTPFVPIDQISNLTAVFSRDDVKYEGFGAFEKNVFIQFRIIGVSKDLGIDNEQNTFVQTLTFPVNSTFVEKTSFIEDVLNKPDTWIQDFNCEDVENFMEQEFADKLEKFFYTDIEEKISYALSPLDKHSEDFDTDHIFTTDKKIAYDRIVIISAKLSTVNNKKVKIYSIEGFDIQPGAEIDPNIELIVGYPFESIPQPPQTYEQISAFCDYNNGGKYKAHVHSAAAIAEEKMVYEERERARILEKMAQDRSFKFGLKPNPTRDMATVFWDGDEMPSYLSLIDGTGQVLFETPIGGDGTSYQLDLSGFSHGVYHVIITSPSGKKGQQKLIKL